MRIVTDSKGVDEPKDPDTCNVFALYRHFASPSEVEEMRQTYLKGGMGYGHAKQALFESMNSLLEGPRERYYALLSEPHQVEAVLELGASKARISADRTLKRIRHRMGISP